MLDLEVRECRSRPPCRRRDRSRWPWFRAPPCVLRRGYRGTARPARSRTVVRSADDDRRRAAARSANGARDRARPLRAGLAEGIVAPGPMTYGSQAAAATQVFEQQRDLALRDRNEQHLVQVDAALARLDEGTYGACTSCGRPIAPERLEAIPWAALCIDCQRTAGARADERGGEPRPRLHRRRPRAPRAVSRASRLRTPLVPFGGAGAALVPQGRVRSSRSARSRSAARTTPSRRCRPTSGRAASSPTRAATTARASPARRGCSARRPSSSCRRTRPRSSASGSPPTAPRSSIVGTGQRRAPGGRRALAAERGLAIIPPFDDDRVIAGQGTIGLEIVEDVPDLAAVLIPIGGGGLASGIAAAIRALRPAARLIGVEPELAADARESLRGGRDRALAGRPVARTIADGDAHPGARPADRSPTCSALLDEIVTVSEDEIAAAVRLAAEEAGSWPSRPAPLRVAALRFRGEERASTASTARRRDRQRRQRRPGTLPGASSTRRPARAG